MERVLVVLASEGGSPPLAPAGPGLRYPPSGRRSRLARPATPGLVLLLLALVLPPNLSAQEQFTDTVLQGELWMPFFPILPGEIDRQVPDQEKLDALLEEMQTVFSGMIYGWSFTYRPIDPARNVPEFLDVVPLGRIRGTTGDVETARALAVATRIDEKAQTLTVTFRYYLTPPEAIRRQAWGASNLDTSQGLGKTRMVDRIESRLEALRQAVKESVRSLLRPRYYNRPQEIRGEAALREVPRYFIQAGQWVCSAKFQLRIVNVREYPLY